MRPGLFKLVIVRHGIKATATGSEYVDVVFAAGEDEEVSAKIWLTEKAAGMARQQMKMIGFDPDSTDLWDLQDKPNLLAGTEVNVIIDQHEKYGWQAEIALGAVGKERVSVLQDRIRNAKSKKAAVPAGGDHDPIMEEDIPF